MELRKHRLSIVYKPLDAVRPNPRNPRRHHHRQIRQLVHVIERLGFNVPLLIDCDGNLLAGHARYEAAQRLGLSELPTIRLEHLDAHQAQAFLLADNRLAELAEWDEELLAAHLKELTLVLDFEVELSGFDMGEVDLRIESLEAKADAKPESS